MKFENNDLRALAGIIMMILAISILFVKESKEIINYILIALAGFLVGGSILQTKTENKKDE
jgi:predicted membrane-bound spermidine synthase